MLVGTDLNKIKYVAVEVIRTGIVKASNVECGLFMGIVKKLDKDKIERNFIALVVSKASVRLYNMEEYHIMTIDTVDDDSRYMTVFTKVSDDQKAAKTLLDEITENFDKDNRLYPNDVNKELIDIDSYTDFPDAALEADNLTADKTDSNDTTTNKSSVGSTSYVGGNHYPSTVKEEPTVSSIKRKGKLPNPSNMDAMRDKVARMAKGKFKLKGLPIPDCDKPVDEDKEEDDKKTDTVLKKTTVARV